MIPMVSILEYASTGFWVVNSHHHHHHDPTTSTNSSTLREAAQGTGIYIGAAINDGYVRNDAAYAKIGSAEFDLITAENACKMNSIANDWDKFNFTGCQDIANYAMENDMVMRGHNLCWANTGQSWYYPAFLTPDTDAARIEVFLKNYITKTAQTFKGLLAWDVVNEAISDNPNEYIRQHSPFFKVDDFICKAFRWAHAADPKAELFYNDYNHLSEVGWMKTKSDKVFKLVLDLKKAGCPIHGIGFQAHVSADMTDNEVEGTISNMKRYADIGIKVHITELDIKCSTQKARADGGTSCAPWTKDNLQRQADLYGKLLTACLKSKNCASFESWGFTDKYSWLPEPMNGLPWDRNMQKKALIYDKLFNTLKNFPRDDPAVLARTTGKTFEQHAQEY